METMKPATVALSPPPSSGYVSYGDCERCGAYADHLVPVGREIVCLKCLAAPAEEPLAPAI